MYQKEIDQFINNLFTQAGLEEVREEFLENYRKKVQEEIEKRLFKVLLINLPDNKLGQFEKLTKKTDASPEEVEKFLKENVNNYPKIIEEELIKFEELFLSKIKNSQQKNA